MRGDHKGFFQRAQTKGGYKVKRIIIATLAATMLLSSSAMAVDFEDTKGHWAESAISTLAGRGVVNGITDTTYEPDGSVTPVVKRRNKLN